MKNNRWFTLTSVALLALTLIGIAVPNSFTAPPATDAIMVTAFVVNQNCQGGDFVQVTLSATVAPDRPAMFRWDFNNDGVFDTQPSSNPTVTHRYRDEKNVTARVAAIRNGQIKDTDTVTFQTLRCGN